MTIRSCINRVLVLCALAPVALGAQQIGIQAGSPFFMYHFNAVTLVAGNTFNVTSPFTVSLLGFFDNRGDGLLHDHEVGIFDAQGALLSWALIPAGTAATLYGDYRVVSVQPFTLGVGTDYNVVGRFIDEDVYGGTLVTAPGIQVTSTPFCASTGALSFLDPRICRSTLIPDMSGATFAGAAAVVTPEPASIVLFGTGILCVGFVARRRVRSA